MFSVLLLSIGLLVVVIVFFHLSKLREINKMNAQMAAYNEEIRRLRADTKDVNKFKAEKEDLQRRLNKIHDLQRAKTGEAALEQVEPDEDREPQPIRTHVKRTRRRAEQQRNQYESTGENSDHTFSCHKILERVGGYDQDGGGSRNIKPLGVCRTWVR